MLFNNPKYALGRQSITLQRGTNLILIINAYTPLRSVIRRDNPSERSRFREALKRNRLSCLSVCGAPVIRHPSSKQYVIVSRGVALRAVPRIGAKRRAINYGTE
ncbi:hypothetical protein EVAR_27836_1 [Eumeta japonica]|uniref:Uncharacterized protein n=1 Tax=Eumeta variegata TaxID=151549 RepID=A0A4C1VJ86_EUMVA|nr:hypothetical protein EVAR_27836_1 [Eumeta japonica]